ncbi:MAG: hypothetical protein IKW03_02770 [Clostridia bacterium]|nr:hypothetical protein [Clostridia bacterium]
MKTIEKLQRMLETASGNPLDIHLVLYRDFISQSETPEQVLRVILEYSSEIGNSEDDSPTLITEDEAFEYYFEYFELVNATLKTIIDKNLSVEDFYKKLYTNVFKLDLLPQDEKGQAVLLYLLSSKKIQGLPYYQATDLLEMDEELYKEIINRIEDKISLGVYMLDRKFKSKTEEISQLWKLASKLESREEQIVFWSVIIGIIRKFERGENEVSDLE